MRGRSAVHVTEAHAGLPGSPPKPGAYPTGVRPSPVPRPATTVMEDRLYSVADWAQVEAESSDLRYEYVHGRLVAMAGGSLRHAEVKGNAGRALGAALSARCLVAESDVRVETVGKGVYRLPDIVVVCGEADVVEIAGVGEAVRNPTLLVEVLSESTSREDLEEKLIEYLALESLVEYWVIDPDKPRLLQYVRGGTFLAYTSEEAMLRSEALGLEVPLRTLYATRTR